MGRIVVAIIAVCVVWMVLDFVIHGLILAKGYEATASLWRPMEEIKMGLLRVVTLLAAIPFVLIYALFFGKKDLITGIKYGALFGFGTGVSMGYGPFAVMPIPYYMAFTWFLGTLVEGVAAGALVGLFLKDETTSPVSS
jgi:hypothetical protein